MRWGFVSSVEQWPEVIEQIGKSEPALRSVGYDKAADLLLLAYREFRDDLTALGANTAVAGTVTLREIEKATRVRHDARPASHVGLNESLVVRDLNTMNGGLIPGWVGIADLELLDKDVRWWRTNEEGSAARVGGKIFGTFFEPGGGTAPNPGSFREHAMFSANVGPGSGPGTIERPIPARFFIKKAVEVIDRDWRREFDDIRNRFEQRLDEVARTHR